MHTSTYTTPYYACIHCWTLLMITAIQQHRCIAYNFWSSLTHRPSPLPLVATERHVISRVTRFISVSSYPRHDSSSSSCCSSSFSSSPILFKRYQELQYFVNIITDIVIPTMPASNGNGNGNGNTSMTSTSSRPGSSKPSTPARGANGGNTGHSSLILRKQLLGKSSRPICASPYPSEWNGKEGKCDRIMTRLNEHVLIGRITEEPSRWFQRRISRR